MRAVLQRVSEASVSVDDRTVGAIGVGVVVLLGVAPSDTDAEAQKMAERVSNLRVFADDAGKMNRSLLETGGGALVLSQFTLYGDARKGRRPSFVGAAQGPEAERAYEAFVAALRALGVATETGEFGAMMQVRLVNDGPVTILLDSDKAF